MSKQDNSKGGTGPREEDTERQKQQREYAHRRARELQDQNGGRNQQEGATGEQKNDQQENAGSGALSTQPAKQGRRPLQGPRRDPETDSEGDEAGRKTGDR